MIETSPIVATLGFAVQPGAGQAGCGHFGSPGSSAQKSFVIVKVPVCEVELNVVPRTTS